MNHAFFIWSGEVNNGDFFHTCLKSLQDISNCKITVYTPKLDTGMILLKSMGINVVKFDKTEWDNRRQVCKVEKIREHLYSLNKNDYMMVFDGDMFMVSNPFEVFEKDFDFFYTSREHPMFPANGGCLGFRCNNESKEFLDIFVENLNNPNWEPYVELRKNHPSKPGLEYKDWWVDQDFLNCIHKYKNEINDGLLDINLKVYDAKNKYNYIIIGKSDEEIFDGIEKNEISVLHFKATSMTRWINDSVGDRMGDRLNRLNEIIRKRMVN